MSIMKASPTAIVSALANVFMTYRTMKMRMKTKFKNTKISSTVA